MSPILITLAAWAAGAAGGSPVADRGGTYLCQCAGSTCRGDEKAVTATLDTARQRLSLDFAIQSQTGPFTEIHDKRTGADAYVMSTGHGLTFEADGTVRSGRYWTCAKQ